jgi:vacuolar-type H+-ATPase subunit F/Vma7
MSKIAFLAPPGSFWGAEEAGMKVATLADPSRLEEEVRRLASLGCSLIVVTDDLAEVREKEAREALEETLPGGFLLVVPGAGSSGETHLSALRERFAAALGADVWKTTARKAGVDR